VLRVPATMILLDHRGAIGGLTFLDHGCPLTISVTVVMAALTNRYTCACRKLNPGILVMQAAQDWATKNVPGEFGGAGDRRILLQR
jgi:hypothetical protein